MINMKDLIKKQGDMIRKQSGMKLVTEKKELHKNQIQAVGQLTQRNNHNVARAMIAKDLLGNNQLYTAYMRIDDLSDFFGHLPPELSQLRRKMDKKYLERGLKAKYENWQELWNEL
tara:strand:- start:181 stop:528 length:348 start_codon:yes stop_codon:yes gene_type:complete